MGTDRSGKVEATSEAENPGAERVSVLDQALWARFSEEPELDEFVRVWLALLIRQAGGVAGGVVVLELEAGSGFVPAATWPKDGDPDARLMQAVEAALERESPAQVGGIAVAQPIPVDGELVGCVGLLFHEPVDDAAERLRALRWGTGWLVAAIRRNAMRGSTRERGKMSAVLDTTAVVLDAESFQGACMAAVNGLARELDCAQVALGFVKRKDMTVAAISDVAEFRLATGNTRALERAMSEAADQAGSVLYPRRENQEYMVDLGHADLVRDYRTGELLTVPLFTGDRAIGALHFQKPQGAAFAADEVMVAEAAGAVLGPLLADKRRADRLLLTVAWEALQGQLARLLGPGYLGRKVAGLAVLALVGFFAFATGEFRVTAQAEVQGQVIRSIVSPFDGHIAEQFTRAGDIVRAGEVIAALDERDLRIELLRWQTDLARYEGEYDKALAELDRPAARIAEANIEQARARIELAERQLARAKLVAPFDAIVISGDLSQSLGATVERGEQLFELAPLENYRVNLEVEESELDEIAVGQKGILVLSSLPSERYEVEVNRITPSLETGDGRNFARVEARLLGGGQQIRPGMRGVAKVYVEDRKLISIWAQPLIDWLRLAFWRWTP